MKGMILLVGGILITCIVLLGQTGCLSVPIPAGKLYINEERKLTNTTTNTVKIEEIINSVI